MKRSLLIISAFLFMLPLWPAGAATESDARFFMSLQDVPLMPGLVELPDQTVVFDKPEGRIVESVAAIDKATQTDIKTYYESTLPQLGWKRIADNSFIRQQESLRMNFETYEGQNYLRIMVAPQEGFQAASP